MPYYTIEEVFENKKESRSADWLSFRITSSNQIVAEYFDREQRGLIASISVSVSVSAWAAISSLVASTTWLLSLGLIDNDGSPFQSRIIELVHGRLCFLIVAHFDKAKAFTSSCLTINNHGCWEDLPILSEKISQVLLCCSIGQSPYVQFQYRILHTDAKGPIAASEIVFPHTWYSNMWRLS